MTKIHLDSKRSSTITLAAVLACRFSTDHVVGDADCGGDDEADQVYLESTCRPWSRQCRQFRLPLSCTPRCSGLFELSPCINIVTITSHHRQIKNLSVSAMAPPISVVPQPYTHPVSPVKSTPGSGMQAGVYTCIDLLSIKDDGHSLWDILLKNDL